MNYTAAEEFLFGRIKQSRIMIVDGSVSVSWRVGSKWVEDQSNPYQTGKYTLSTAATCAKITPSPGSEFYIDETEA